MDDLDLDPLQPGEVEDRDFYYQEMEKSPINVESSKNRSLEEVLNDGDECGFRVFDEDD